MLPLLRRLRRLRRFRRFLQLLALELELELPLEYYCSAGYLDGIYGEDDLYLGG